MKIFYKIIVLLLLIGAISLNADQSQKNESHMDQIIQKEFGFSADQLVNLVARRYYFVHRLSASYMALRELYTHRWSKLKSTVQEQIIQLPENMVLHNLAVKLSVLKMIQSKSLQPIFILWDELIHYKLLDDEQFIKEFVHIFYLISRNALVAIVPALQQRLAIVPEITDTLCPEQEAEFIDLFWQSIRQNKPLPELKQMSIKEQHVAPVTVNEVMMRYYQLKRLTDAQLLVSKECKKSGKCAIAYHEYNNQIILHNQIVFSDPIVVDCIKKIVSTTSYLPFIKLFNDVASYKHLQNVNFMREALMLFYIVYGQMAQHVAKSAKKRAINAATMQMVHEMYTQLPNLSVDEVLDAIDILTQEVTPLMAQYELNSDMTWQVWLKKYWWLPPTLMAVIGTKLYLKVLDAHYGARRSHQEDDYYDHHDQKNNNSSLNGDRKMRRRRSTIA